MGAERGRDVDVAIVGAGPAGIATALALADRGVRPTVLDQADRVASSWHSRYDALRLNTWRRFSQLPGRPYPKGTPKFPSRDQVVSYLERHAREDGLELRLGTRVEQIVRRDGTWLLETSAGELQGTQVVVATGFEGEPRIPDWPGRERFSGPLVHSSEYRNPEPFAGRRVLVVGAGCSGMEIAHDLATGGAAKVWLSARTPPNILLREGVGGLPGDVIGVALMRFPTWFGDAFTRFGRRMDLGDLADYGLPVPAEGAMSRLRRDGVSPSIVDREVIDSIKAGQIAVIRGVERLDRSAVELSGGARVEADAVISATGYRRGLESLVGHLGVLGADGKPKALGERPAAPGLRFIGYVVPRPGGLGYMAREARRAARAIAHEVRKDAALSQPS